MKKSLEFMSYLRHFRTLSPSNPPKIINNHNKSNQYKTIFIRRYLQLLLYHWCPKKKLWNMKYKISGLLIYILYKNNFLETNLFLNEHKMQTDISSINSWSSTSGSKFPQENLNPTVNARLSLKILHTF